MDILQMTVLELAAALNDGELTSVKITEAYLAQISALDKQIHAYITVCPELALQMAEAADKRRTEGKTLSSLDGIPVALKDIFCTDGVLTTCASRILSNFVPPYNATCWQKLVDSGAVLLGKCNMDEFAMGSTTESSYFGPTKNPHDLSCVPGGSSGGSAAAVAALMAPYSLGTDTGGSVRQPASFCGLVGLKPTYGRISRFGVVAYASSLDQVGILSRTVADCADILALIAGNDPLDSTCSEEGLDDYAAACTKGIKGMKIGLPAEFLAEGIDKRIIAKVQEAAHKLQEQGAEIVEVSLPHTRYALPAYYILATAEASSNLARYDGIRYGVREQGEDLEETYLQSRSHGFCDEVKRRIMLGTYALSSGYYDAYYNKTLQVRTLVREDYLKAFNNVDCLLTPTAPSVAYPLGSVSDNPLAMYMGDVCTVTVNMAGLPGLAVPYGLLDEKPLGLQLIGKPFDEATLLAVGSVLEAVADKTPTPAIAVKGGQR